MFSGDYRCEFFPDLYDLAIKKKWASLISMRSSVDGVSKFFSKVPLSEIANFYVFQNDMPEKSKRIARHYGFEWALFGDEFDLMESSIWGMKDLNKAHTKIGFMLVKYQKSPRQFMKAAERTLSGISLALDELEYRRTPAKADAEEEELELQLKRMLEGKR